MLASTIDAAWSPMNRTEAILLGSIVLVAGGALLLERADITTVRNVAIGIVMLLNIAFIYGGIRRIRRRNAEARAIFEAMAEAQAEAARQAAADGSEAEPEKTR